MVGSLIHRSTTTFNNRKFRNNSKFLQVKLIIDIDALLSSKIIHTFARRQCSNRSANYLGQTGTSASQVGLEVSGTLFYLCNFRWLAGGRYPFAQVYATEERDFLSRVWRGPDRVVEGLPGTDSRLHSLPR